METKPQNKLELLKSLSPLTFTDHEEIKSSFLKLYAATHPGERTEDAEAFYERESNYFKRIIFGSNDLRQCTMFSLYGCFMDVVVNGLSFDPSANLLYVEVRNFNIGTKDNAKWEKRAGNKISPYGELSLRVKYGQIKHIDNPVVVYSCDTFRKGYDRNTGVQWVDYEARIPRAADAKIIASFVKVTRPDNSFDFPHLEEQDIERLRSYSERQNKGTANALYGKEGAQIDPGFLKAKTIRHAFKAFPKVNILGAFSSFDEEEPEATVYSVPAEETTKPLLENRMQVPPQPQAVHNDFMPSANGQEVKPVVNGATISFESDEF